MCVCMCVHVSLSVCMSPCMIVCKIVCKISFSLGVLLLPLLFGRVVHSRTAHAAGCERSPREGGR